MGKYSSDSSSSGSRRRVRSRRRSSSSSSADRRRHTSHRSKAKRRCNHSSSKSSGHRRRSHSRSLKHSRSSSRDRDRHRRHSKSRDYSRSSHSSKSRSRRRSSSSNSSSSSTSTSSTSKDSSKKHAGRTGSGAEDLREKLLQAIKAAESADTQLKKQGVLPSNVKSRNDIGTLAPSKPDVEVISEIDAEGFAPKAFKSTKGNSKNPEKERQPVEVVEDKVAPTKKDLFHASLFDDPKKKMDRWVKKLFQVRQRALRGESPG